MLLQNRSRLAETGFDFACSNSFPNLHPFVGPGHGKTLLPQGFKVSDPEGLIRELTSGKQAAVVGSSENFSFFFEPDRVADLAALLRPHFAEIRIITYLRRQDRHAISHHQEGAKPNRSPEGALWGHAPVALPPHDPAQDLYLDYEARLMPWARAFGEGNMIIRVYDRTALKQQDIAADFLSLIGLDTGNFQPVDDRNISLGAAQAKIGHLLADANVAIDVVSSILKSMPRTGRLRPSRDEAQRFMSHYVDSNRRLNARFGISAEPDLFDADFSDYPDEPQSDWTEETASDAMRALLLHLDGSLPALSVDDLRTAAEVLQKTKPLVALRLVRAALTLRPKGPALLKLQDRLQGRLSPGATQDPTALS